jgi:hypothetical protein
MTGGLWQLESDNRKTGSCRSSRSLGSASECVDPLDTLFIYTAFFALGRSGGIRFATANSPRFQGCGLAVTGECQIKPVSCKRTPYSNCSERRQRMKPVGDVMSLYLSRPPTVSVAPESDLSADSVKPPTVLVAPETTPPADCTAPPTVSVAPETVVPAALPKEFVVTERAPVVVPKVLPTLA